MADSELEELASLPDPTPAFYRQWVRKEALVKVGAGQLSQLPYIELGLSPATPRAWKGWRLADWDAAEGPTVVGAVAFPEDRP